MEEEFSAKTQRSPTNDNNNNNIDNNDVVDVEQQNKPNQKKSFWKKFLNWLYWFFYVSPILITIIMRGTDGPVIVKFTFSVIALIPLAKEIGDATEIVSEFAGPTKAGILNAFLGNVAELINGIFFLRNKQYNLLKQTLIGSVLSNLMLAHGMAIFWGSWKNKRKEQKLRNGLIHSAGALHLFAAAVLFIIPSIIVNINPQFNHIKTLNITISIILLICYLAFSVYQLDDDRTDPNRIVSSTHSTNTSSPSPSPPQTITIPDVEQIVTREERQRQNQGNQEEEAKPSLRNAIIRLIITIAAISVASDVLTNTIEQVATNASIQLFLAIIVIPIAGNTSEHYTAVISAPTQPDQAVTTTVTSALQIATFLFPLLEIFSYINPTPMTLIIDTFQLVTMLISTIIAMFVLVDSKTNWNEGIILMAIYIVWAVCFYIIG